MLEVVFHQKQIEFRDGTINLASVAEEPFLDASDIGEVRLDRWPPEIVTKHGEVLFIQRQNRKHLDLFARINGIARVERMDVWSLITEPYLDTQFSSVDSNRTLTLLRESGFLPTEINEIREKIASRMMSYNSIAWEWMHLGHADVLTAFGMYDRRHSHDIAQKDLYDEFNAISNRGKQITHIDWSSESTLKPMLIDLIAPDLQDKLVNLIISRYREPHRRYHTLDHVLDVAERCRDAQSLCDKEDRLSLQLAALFHDIVYDPKSQRNEENSADLMIETLGAHVASRDLNAAAKIILMTKSHSSAHTKSEKVFADADLAILAEEKIIYDSYVKNIRNEYAHVDDYTFKAGRLVFLETMLDQIKRKGRLFHNLHPLHEFQAVKNLTNERDASF
jgi:predicted metal-dependent HD superfamily phosphohydrolase